MFYSYLHYTIRILIVQVKPPNSRLKSRVCGGNSSKGPNMIEDCGGIWGFYNCINEAEPFDLEAVNSDFKNWSLPETNPESEPYDFDPDLDEWEIFENLLTGLTGENKENQKQMEEFMMEMKHQEQEARQAAPPLLSLEDVFLCYSKDEMKQIACYYGFTGYNKFNKKELAQWLKNPASIHEDKA